MANMDTRWEQLQAAFRTELEEAVRTLNGLLLRLEGSGADEQVRTETLAALFREAHSLKGAARAVELVQVESLAHALESVLESARQRGTRPTERWFTTMFRAADAFTLV